MGTDDFQAPGTAPAAARSISWDKLIKATDQMRSSCRGAGLSTATSVTDPVTGVMVMLSGL
jgi:hypothetical protein